jgi:hypothetical protein
VSGYRVACTVCGREEQSGESPLTTGWPKCCGYTMRLVDTDRFIADVDRHVGAAAALLTFPTPVRRCPPREMGQR